MRPATLAQQAAYDAMMDLANILKSGREPTRRDFDKARDALALLKLEPQPDAFVETLEAALGALESRSP